MYLMGQALFTLELLRPFGPSSVRSVAVCERDDAVLRPLLERYEGVSVVIASELPGEPLPSGVAHVE